MCGRVSVLYRRCHAENLLLFDTSSPRNTQPMQLTQPNGKNIFHFIYLLLCSHLIMFTISALGIFCHEKPCQAMWSVWARAHAATSISLAEHRIDIHIRWLSARLVIHNNFPFCSRVLFTFFLDNREIGWVRTSSFLHPCAFMVALEVTAWSVF